MTAVVPMFTPDEISRAIGAMGSSHQLRALEKWLWWEAGTRRLPAAEAADPRPKLGGLRRIYPHHLHGQLRWRSSSRQFLTIEQVTLRMLNDDLPGTGVEALHAAIVM